MRELFKILLFITSHPISGKSKIRTVLRFFWWQFRSRLINEVYIHSFTENSKLILRRGMTGATGNLYCGLHEHEEMLFLLHFLRPEDVFVDVGANIGSYSILASAEIGAKSYSFEPVPNTFNDFHQNIVINSIERKVTAYNYGVDSVEGRLFFSNNTNSSMNHVVYNDSLNDNNISVDVVTLDKTLENDSPSILKIDVEGFEMKVLMGATRILNDNNLKAIIIELNGSGESYGFNDESIHQFLVSKGFLPYRYNPFERKLLRTNSSESDNFIYLRDYDFVKERLKSAKQFRILNLYI